MMTNAFDEIRDSTSRSADRRPCAKRSQLTGRELAIILASATSYFVFVFFREPIVVGLFRQPVGPSVACLARHAGRMQFATLSYQLLAPVVI